MKGSSVKMIILLINPFIDNYYLENINRLGFHNSDILMNEHNSSNRHNTMLYSKNNEYLMKIPQK